MATMYSAEIQLKHSHSLYIASFLGMETRLCTDMQA